MAEYIERELAIEALSRGEGCGNVCRRAIERILAADVAPVRHGRWEKTADGAVLCTACKRKMNSSQYGYAFCSLCGAKMDGDVD